jgi:hypothetical protein
MKLEKVEIDYLKHFLKVTEEKGIYGLVSACENRAFAMYPLEEIIKKIIESEEEFLD